MIDNPENQINQFGFPMLMENFFFSVSDFTIISYPSCQNFAPQISMNLKEKQLINLSINLTIKYPETKKNVIILIEIIKEQKNNNNNKKKLTFDAWRVYR